MHPIRSSFLFAGLLALALTLPASNVFAQVAGRAHQMQAELKKRFDAADVNHDGQLTKDEAQAGMPMVYQHFDAIDTAHRGTITLADITAFVRAQRAAKAAS